MDANAERRGFAEQQRQHGVIVDSSASTVRRMPDRPFFITIGVM